MAEGEDGTITPISLDLSPRSSTSTLTSASDSTFWLPSVIDDKELEEEEYVLVEKDAECPRRTSGVKNIVKVCRALRKVFSRK